MERIYSAAIWYKTLDVKRKLDSLLELGIDSGTVLTGHRHADIIRTVLILTGKRTCTGAEDCTGPSEQGFITNRGRFVNRVEAMKIARKANQLITNTTFRELYSEDLY
jgi:hypothetical protein